MCKSPKDMYKFPKEPGDGSGDAPHASRLKIRYRAAQIVLAVHHERTMADDRPVERIAAAQDQLGRARHFQTKHSSLAAKPSHRTGRYPGLVRGQAHVADHDVERQF